MNRRFAVMTLALLTTSGLLSAKTPVDRVNKGQNGVALRGYDAVAYFVQGQPGKGSKGFTYEWNGAVWHFQSEQSRAQFQSNPVKYAPQYGGYCAWAVSNNYTADADPEAWKIVDGKLYLNYSKSVQKKWEPEAEERIQNADRNWPALHK
jgi:hypothetical protein